MSQASDNSGEVATGASPGPEAFGPYSLARVASGNRILFMSGHCAWDENLSIVGGRSIGDQYRQIMRILKGIVEDAGGTMNDVVKLVNYMAVPFSADAPAYDEIVQARSEFFPGEMPASTMIQVASLGDPDALVEVDAIAVFD